MKLYEHEGKKLFRKYGIATPKGLLVRSVLKESPMEFPVVLKAQVLTGDRKRFGGILFATDAKEFVVGCDNIFHGKFGNEEVGKILVEEKIEGDTEYYASLSYDTEKRMPVLALSTKGGTGISHAKLFHIDLALGFHSFVARNALTNAGFPSVEIPALARVLENLWNLFENEYAILAEINPLIKDKKGKFIAADAKVIIDDEKLKPMNRRFLTLGGDIAILASGGGASLLNIDALLNHGGRPANYTEYSGNPSADVVKKITRKVLNQKGLRGCWVVGGTANFTDIYETMRGFLEGLREVSPKPRYPFVIRRDGPRQKEAMEMLAKAAERWGYDFSLYDSNTPMAETARIIVERAYNKK
jgi:succinyl-CoA synthetase beta subunit